MSSELVMFTVSSLLQFLNAERPISFTVGGILISVRFTQLINAVASIFLRFAGNLTLASLAVSYTHLTLPTKA